MADDDGLVLLDEVGVGVWVPAGLGEDTCLEVSAVVRSALAVTVGRMLAGMRAAGQVSDIVDIRVLD